MRHVLSNVRPPVLWTSFLILACAIAAPAPSHAAGVPSPADSDAPCQIDLVGTNVSGVPDSHGEVTITIRDLAHNPLPGSFVVLDFNGCAPSHRVSSVQSGGLTVSCSGPVGTVQGTTDASGQITLRVAGGGITGPGSGFNCGVLYADGVMIRHFNVGIYDLNSVNGLNVADLSLWFGDAFGTYTGRADYDCSQSVAPPDLARILPRHFAGESSTSCAGYCH